MTDADTAPPLSFAEHEHNADVTRRMTNLCRAYFFAKDKPVHRSGHRRRLRRELVCLLRDQVVFPDALIHVMRCFGDAAIDAGRELDWSIPEYYNDNEKQLMFLKLISFNYLIKI